MINSIYQAIRVEDAESSKVSVPPDMARLLEEGRCKTCDKPVVFLSEAYHKHKQAHPDSVLVCTKCGQTNVDEVLKGGHPVIIEEHTTKDFERAAERHKAERN